MRRAASSANMLNWRSAVFSTPAAGGPKRVHCHSSLSGGGPQHSGYGLLGLVGLPGAAGLVECASDMATLLETGCCVHRPGRSRVPATAFIGRGCRGGCKGGMKGESELH